MRGLFLCMLYIVYDVYGVRCCVGRCGVGFCVWCVGFPHIRPGYTLGRFDKH